MERDGINGFLNALKEDLIEQAHRQAADQAQEVENQATEVLREMNESFRHWIQRIRDTGMVIPTSQRLAKLMAPETSAEGERGFGSAVLTREFAREVNEKVGSKLPDEFEMRRLWDIDLRERKAGSLENNPPQEWIDIMVGLSSRDRGIVTMALHFISRAGITTSGELRGLSVDDLDGLPRIGQGMARFLRDSFIKSEPQSESD